jgi:hypothetical protein
MPEKKDYDFNKDMVVSEIFNIVERIPPYHRRKLTNLRHIINVVASLKDKLRHEAEVKASTGAYDPAGQEEAEKKLKEDSKPKRKRKSKDEDED